MAAEPRRQQGKAKVFLVDDHPILREGLTQLINREKDLEVCGEAGTAQEALEAIPTVKPDVGIVDIALKGVSGLELIKELSVHHSELPVLVLSMYDESLYAERCIRAGAKGYVMKEDVSERVVAGIRSVLRGDIYVGERIVAKLLHKLSGDEPETTESLVDRLSDRELQVFELIGRGRRIAEIADKLCLSVKTIEGYREQIKKKLKLKRADELLQYATRWVDRLGTD